MLIFSAKSESMIKKLLLIGIAALAIEPATAQTAVWSTDVAPILYNNCASCHRTGGIAPFDLISYSNAVTYANAIASAVSAKRMPPWPPNPSFSRLAHERLLEQQEIDKIVDWVNNGKPQGDPGLAPPAPVFNNDGDLPGTPDLVTQIPTYASTASTGDMYRCFVVPSGLNVDKFITGFEAIPGNRGIVHHVLVFADTTGVCAQLDAADPEPGYTSFGGPGTNDARMIGGWVPGTAPLTFPQGFGVRLPKNADIVIQIHYPAGSAGMVDSTKIRFFFSPTNNVRNVFIDPVLNHFTSMDNGPLFIPANETKTFYQSFEAPIFFNYTILGVAPHMHLIGRNMTVYAVSPSLDTQNFIQINDWNFHWQGFYMFPKLKKIEGGSKLYSHAFYDNTSLNVWNPSNPPQDVSAGEATTDEMMLTYFIYTFYQSGDEEIVIDSTVTTDVKPYTYYRGQQLLELYPNPASNQLIVKCYLEEKDRGSIEIISMDGRLVRSLMTEQVMDRGYKAYQFDVSDLPAGIYHVRLRTSERTMSGKLLVE